MANPKNKPATYADIEALPEHITGEIIFGVLETQPRPAQPHALAAGGLGYALGPPFHFGRGNGPGGWIIIPEPELHLGPHILVPDFGGWRRERYAGSESGRHVSVPPDWVCEILSPATERRDRTDKRRIYATYGVDYLWFINPVERVLEVFKRQDKDWLLTHSFAAADEVSAPPFEAISFSLGLLWPFDPPPSKQEA